MLLSITEDSCRFSNFRLRPCHGSPGAGHRRAPGAPSSVPSSGWALNSEAWVRDNELKLEPELRVRRAEAPPLRLARATWTVTGSASSTAGPWLARPPGVPVRQPVSSGLKTEFGNLKTGSCRASETPPAQASLGRLSLSQSQWVRAGSPGCRGSLSPSPTLTRPGLGSPGRHGGPGRG